MLDRLSPRPGSRGTTQARRPRPGLRHGKTSGRGVKGQGKRSARPRDAVLLRRRPDAARAPRCPSAASTACSAPTYRIVNVGALAPLRRRRRGRPGRRSSARGLVAARRAGVKLLAEGEPPRNLRVQVHQVSAAARKKIEAAGGIGGADRDDRRRPEHRADPGAPAADPLHVRDARGLPRRRVHRRRPASTPRSIARVLRADAGHDLRAVQRCSRAARSSSSRSSRWASCPTSAPRSSSSCSRSSIPQLEELRKEGEQGQRRITQYTRYGTIGLALFQGFCIARRARERRSSARAP